MKVGVDSHASCCQATFLCLHVVSTTASKTQCQAQHYTWVSSMQWASIHCENPYSVTAKASCQSLASRVKCGLPPKLIAPLWTSILHSINTNAIKKTRPSHSLWEKILVVICHTTICKNLHIILFYTHVHVQGGALKLAKLHAKGTVEAI